MSRTPRGHAAHVNWANALAFIGLLFIAGPVRGQAPQQPLVPADTHTYASGAHETLLTVTHVEIPSKTLHVTRDVSIWVPDEPSKGTRYAVLIFPDAEEKVQFRSALANIEFLINRGVVPPLIVVGLPYYANRMHELTPQATGATAQNFPAAGGADATMLFIADELIPWVDAHYPTLPTRVLVGHSAGGVFALYTMTTRPDVFRIVLALSPALWWNDGALSNEVTASLVSDTAHRRTLFVTSGGLEPQIDESTTAFAVRLRAMLDSAHATQLRFERRRYAGDVHEMTPLEGLIDGLRMAFSPMVVPIDSVVGDLAAHHVEDASAIRAASEALKTRYATGAASLGITAPLPEPALDALGGYALQVKQGQLAVSFLRENLDHYPQSSNAHESLGEGLVAVGDTAEAGREFRTAVSIATAEMAKPGSVLVRAQARDVMLAAEAQLAAMRTPSASAH